MRVKDYEFQIFFSGVESDKYYDIVVKETNAVLVSYYYLRQKPKTFLANRISKCKDLRMIVDSGAHTFFEKPEEFSKKPMEYWETYIEKYVAWVRENKAHIFACAELDIDVYVGPEKVNEWRDKYFKPLEEEGVQVIYMWHQVRGEKDWEQMCKKYKYVGVSLQEEVAEYDKRKLSKMFAIAKRYKTKIHGMAVTGLDMMSSFPWASCDSTTWLIGTQYGELNFFDGRKMMRLKKQKWKRQYKNKLIQLGADWSLAEREDPYELIRINVLTFLKVQDFVRRKMSTQAYWREGVANVKRIVRKPVEEDSTTIARGTLPTKEWFSGSMEDWEKYAEALGIDTNIVEDEGKQLIKDFYNFIKFTPEVQMYDEKEVYYFCDVFGLKEINTKKKAIEALPQCFKDHAAGLRNEFGSLQDAKEASVQRAKDREDFLEESETVTVELSKKEVEAITSAYLPAPEMEMSEVEAYDEILEQAGVVAIRDEKGRLVKGQQVIRKTKKLHDKMPRMSCDTCYKGQDCPEYRAGYVCAYDKLFKRFNTRDKEDVMDVMYGLVELNIERMQRMVAFETMDGGMVDPNVSALIDQNMKYLKQLKEMQEIGNRIVAQRRVIIDSQGNSEMVDSVTGNPQAGGILQQIFGGLSASKGLEDEDEEVINVTPVKEDAEKEEKKE